MLKSDVTVTGMPDASAVLLPSRLFVLFKAPQTD